MEDYSNNLNNEYFHLAKSLNGRNSDRISKISKGKIIKSTSHTYYRSNNFTL